MKTFKKIDGSLWAFEEDGSQDHFITNDMTPITEAEAATIRNPPLTAEQLSSAEAARRDGLLVIAAIRIAPLKDAVDLDIATTTEKSSLVAWKQYRVALNRIEQQAGYPQSIIWPQQPA